MYDKLVEIYSNRNWALHSGNSIKLISNMINFSIRSCFASVFMHFAHTICKQCYIVKHRYACTSMCLFLHLKYHFAFIDLICMLCSLCQPESNSFSNYFFYRHRRRRFRFSFFKWNTENSLTGMSLPYIDCLIQKFTIHDRRYELTFARKQYRMNPTIHTSQCFNTRETSIIGKCVSCVYVW